MATTAGSKPGAWVVPTVIALALGAALWILGGVASGRKEPWDTGVYWSAIYPLSMLGSAAFARWIPAHAWRWALWIFLGQFVGATLKAGEVSNLWPIAVVMFVALSVPGMVLAVIVARLSRNRR